MVEQISMWAIIEVAKVVGKLIVRIKELNEELDDELDKMKNLIDILVPRIEALSYRCGGQSAGSSATPKLTARRKKEMDDLHQLLKESEELLEECRSSKNFKPYKIKEYSERLRRSRKRLREFISINMLLDIHVESMTGNSILSCAVPIPPDLIVGFEESLEALRRKLLLGSPPKVLGICGMGGSGKTTLAAKLCNDSRVTAEYGEPIFLTISSSPDLEKICGRLLEKFNGTVGTFVSQEDAINGLARYLSRRTEKMLIVLDDVWSDNDIKKLVDAIKRAADFQILITSRIKLKVCDWSYNVNLLSLDDARKLFEHHALLQGRSIWRPDKQLIDEIVKGCKHHPIALKVMGSSLAKEDGIMWQNVADTLAQTGGIFKDRHGEIIACLMASFGPLTKEEHECFLDLGSFPENQAIPANVMIDMWTETHNLNENSAYEILQELCRRNLVRIIDRKGGDAGDPDRSFSSLCVSQHDLLRELAIHESRKENNGQVTRLIMEKREGVVPDTWTQEKRLTNQAKLVSINTGDMEWSNWPDLDLPNAEVLILNFSASSYCLPRFLQSMKNLKVLIVANHGSNRAELDGLCLLPSLKKLKRVIFRKIILPAEPLRMVEGGSWSKLWKFLISVAAIRVRASAEPPQELQKLSLVLCDVRHMLHIPSLFPIIRDLEVDYCTELEELPDTICDISNLEKLSITNFSDLLKLPDGIGKLQRLKVLRLHACGNLEGLPYSLSQLSELRYLDISYCSNLDAFPEGIENLSCLEKIDIRSCSRMTELPPSLVQMECLKKVICDEEGAYLWNYHRLNESKLDVWKGEVNLGFLQLALFFFGLLVVVGKLIYMTVTRPDITYAVSEVSKYMHAPRPAHHHVVDRILRYFKDAPGQGLWMRRNGSTVIEGYLDVQIASLQQVFV